MVLILNRDKWYLLIDCNIEDGLMVVYLGDKGHPYYSAFIARYFLLGLTTPYHEFFVFSNAKCMHHNENSVYNNNM